MSGHCQGAGIGGSSWYRMINNISCDTDASQLQTHPRAEVHPPDAGPDPPHARCALGAEDLAAHSAVGIATVRCAELAEDETVMTAANNAPTPKLRTRPRSRGAEWPSKHRGHWPFSTRRDSWQ